jgi:hypothetical protein
MPKLFSIVADEQVVLAEEGFHSVSSPPFYSPSSSRIWAIAWFLLARLALVGHRILERWLRGILTALLVLLQPNESDYIPFLDVRKTPITPFLQFDVAVSDPEADETTTRIREMVKKDRALYDKAQKAFVSWVRRLVHIRRNPFCSLGARISQCGFIA